MKGGALVRIIGLCEAFCLGVAVLVFVFPALDTLVTFGSQRLTLRLILWTLSISGVFFLGATLMSILVARMERAKQ
jgi:hypothetical protein